MSIDDDAQERWSEQFERIRIALYQACIEVSDDEDEVDRRLAIIETECRILRKGHEVARRIEREARARKVAP